MKWFCIVSILFFTSCAGGGHYIPKKTSNRQDFWGDILTEIEYTPKQRALISKGKSLLGAKYVYGGEHPSEGGFDCSGFTQYVYSQSLGQNLPRTARQQNRVGRSVSSRNLTAGDLVFFDLDGTLSHVGIYLGNGKFFHASPSKGQILIGDMRKKYFANRYNSARRVLN